jgi:hypothetical protein
VKGSLIWSDGTWVSRDADRNEGRGNGRRRGGGILVGRRGNRNVTAGTHVSKCSDHLAVWADIS